MEGKGDQEAAEVAAGSSVEEPSCPVGQDGQPIEQIMTVRIGWLRILAPRSTTLNIHLVPYPRSDTEKQARL